MRVTTGRAARAPDADCVLGVGKVVIWGLLFVVYAIQFRIQWLIIITVALSLSTANIVGYT